jgi:inosine/xanthosine triphosphate pyrophosphatase family protein
VAAVEASGLPALADDCRIVVPRPGHYSSRWDGPTKDFCGAMEGMQRELGHRDRSAMLRNAPHPTPGAYKRLADRGGRPRGSFRKRGEGALSHSAGFQIRRGKLPLEPGLNLADFYRLARIF